MRALQLGRNEYSTLIDEVMQVFLDTYQQQTNKRCAAIIADFKKERNLSLLIRRLVVWEAWEEGVR